MAEDRIVKPVAISGFPEWLPQVRLVEQQWLDRIRATYERYGFCSVETPSVEALEVLMSKGETSQEVYTLNRLQADPAAGSDARLGLHFDLTVPLARYVAQHFNELVFPFKRYQIQRVWRGERPQEGRFREFTQCDIDVINLDSLPLSFDAELPRIIHEVLTDLEIGGFTLGINNRKVLQGFYEGIGITDPIGVIRIADKLAKIGPNAVGQLLGTELGLTDTQIKACLDLAQVSGGAEVVDEIARLGSGGALLDEGLSELGFVMRELADLPAGSVVADLSIARGLDYYTGTVYEGTLNDAPGFGSICSGGRYDDLAGSFIRRHLPGIGMSIGLTRIFAKLVADGTITGGPLSPAQVLVIVPSDDRRPEALATAATLRSRGFKVETYHAADKLKKQLTYGSRKQIPYLWFPPFENGKSHEVKNMASGEQVAADPQTWTPSTWRSVR
ncbi:histidine--tRNA ligase [Sporichthya sp.]|uniref:histidine--tRNA ligase n=1 Tax=Sporichthya sp. TaxID=65475 RepID=UPI0017C1BE10|nr:histidine--tRNA ligase [Sporichthya sp.]MBA3742396.1 histidine--tRNA ligase [Sporichthya sp.]